MKLNVNIADIPNKVPLIDPGEYHCTIVKFYFADATERQKNRYEAELHVSEGPMTGRRLYDNFPIEFLQQNGHPVNVKFGHFARSAGVTGENPDTEDFVNKSVRATVNHRSYKDSEGVQQTVANVKDYVA